MAFRQTNAVWQPAMEKWFKIIVDMMAKGSFFATQGGPIVLVQVENELPATDKGYVNWCGTMAQAALDAALSAKLERPMASHCIAWHGIAEQTRPDQSRPRKPDQTNIVSD